MKFPYNQVLVIKAQYQSGKLDRETAKEQLAYLLDLKDDTDLCKEAAEITEHRTQYNKPASYGPLMRLSDVCNTLRLFARTFCTPLPTDDEHKKKERAEHYEHFSKVDLAISKSNLLARLFFTDEGLRKTPCPEHKGRWSGCQWDTPCECRTGSNVTGWLAEDPKFADITYWNKPYKVTSKEDPK
jgi:hypothetical protein